MDTKKITYSAMLTAIGVLFANFIFFPVGVSKTTPIQHIINVISAVTLGPGYAVLIAFSISLIRNFIGTGTLLAFPGSMIGAFFAGLLYKKTNKKLLAVFGEIFGTGIVGAILAFPIAKYVIGKDVGAFFFVMPFLINTVTGSIIAFIILEVLDKTKSFYK
ncbi:energy coupling factor transporter S component ThiW [Thermoanaerobacterium sp. RBIITD]|uniref:energy coupling factor transporter S component ThiW n=1 Tax=Thermoanaerobacterium sp. RBIITD TaxID=1550240 RepID=UPI000BB95781|nr:energy coupling factor transporter S component ThiW [Thermoanaerobacterium sp. RBIITD]SNX52835.1 energy coupling factor transporter S component ThiW [Thermoanaerobacterium sp. RBIITD]